MSSLKIRVFKGGEATVVQDASVPNVNRSQKSYERLLGLK